jgi:hypothetical protein
MLSASPYGNPSRDYEEESRGDGKSKATGLAALAALTGTPDPAPTFRGNTAAEDACG